MCAQMVDHRGLTKVCGPLHSSSLRIPHPSLYKHEVMKQLGHKLQLQGARLETMGQVCRVVWVSVEDVCCLYTHAKWTQCVLMPLQRGVQLRSQWLTSRFKLGSLSSLSSEWS